MIISRKMKSRKNYLCCDNVSIVHVVDKVFIYSSGFANNKELFKIHKCNKDSAKNPNHNYLIFQLGLSQSND